MLDVEVNQVVEDLDVRHLDARVLGQSLTYQINVLIDVYCDSFSSHNTQTELPRDLYFKWSSAPGLPDCIRSPSPIEYVSRLNKSFFGGGVSAGNLAWITWIGPV
jgi:hypothetical protein